MFKNLSIAVIGSINLDLVATVKHFPRPGETITNAVLQRFGGGKGANQAIAARRLGAEVFMIGRVGADPNAEDALSTLNQVGVNLDYCSALASAPTGLAMIVVSEDGENQIVVAPGANAVFAESTLDLPRADAFIAQMEIPMETIFQAATAKDSFFCLNAAPAKPIPADLLEHIDLLVVNELEAQILASDLSLYKGLLAITYGPVGATLSRGGDLVATSRPPAVNAIDTTGAGDAFTAALTLALVSGMTEQAALDLACRVGALTTTRIGAQSSPYATELE